MKLINFLSVRNTLLLISAAAFNFMVYIGGKVIAGGKFHYNFTTALDEAIPVVKWTILIYLGCYAFWFANYCLGVKYDKSGSDRFIKAHFIGETVCLIAFVFLPTTMISPEFTGTGIFDFLFRLTYGVDSADNLLPSLHCFASWLCWIGVRGNENVSKWYQNASLVMAIAVCISTLTVKQHVIVDAVTGVALAELSYALAGLMGRRNAK